MRRLVGLWSLLALFGSGCGDAELSTLRLSWSFEGGLDCASAGVSEVRVTANAGSQAVATLPCMDGLAPNAVALGEFERGIVLIHAEATGAVGVGYEGRARVEMRNLDVDAALVLSPPSP